MQLLTRFDTDVNSENWNTCTCCKNTYKIKTQIKKNNMLQWILATAAANAGHAAIAKHDHPLDPWQRCNILGDITKKKQQKWFADIISDTVYLWSVHLDIQTVWSISTVYSHHKHIQLPNQIVNMLQSDQNLLHIKLSTCSNMLSFCAYGVNNEWMLSTSSDNALSVATKCFATGHRLDSNITLYAKLGVFTVHCRAMRCPAVPRESCSCPTSGRCYHLLTDKQAIGMHGVAPKRMYLTWHSGAKIGASDQKRQQVANIPYCQCQCHSDDATAADIADTTSHMQRHMPSMWQHGTGATQKQAQC